MKPSTIAKKFTIKSASLIFFGLLFMRGIFYSAVAQSLSPVNTTLRITTWVFSFGKDTGGSMGYYFSGDPCNYWATMFTWNTWAGIDFWTTGIALVTQWMFSSGNHRFTASDMLWQSFRITIQSTALTGWLFGLSTAVIPPANVTYTGTNWCGTGYVLTKTWAIGTNPSAALSSPYDMAARENNSWLSLWSQNITMKVSIPAAQWWWRYTWVLLFTQF